MAEMNGTMRENGAPRHGESFSYLPPAGLGNHRLGSDRLGNDGLGKRSQRTIYLISYAVPWHISVSECYT